MFNNIINYESIHTQSAYETELRVRAREEQRFMLGLDSIEKEAGQVKRISNPVKARPTGFFSTSKAFLQAMIGTLSTGRG